MGQGYFTDNCTLHGVRPSVKDLIAPLLSEHKGHMLLWNVSPVLGHDRCLKYFLIECTGSSHVEMNLFLLLLLP